MKFKTLSNREIRMDVLPERYPMRSREQSKSLGQFSLGRILRTIYGQHVMILEEFPLPDERLWLDFYMPHHHLAFEYQGEQHDKFNRFFHGDKKGLDNSKKRDERKRQWCDINDICLVEVRGTITVDKLQNLIQQTRENQ